MIITQIWTAEGWIKTPKLKPPQNIGSPNMVSLQ